MEVPSPEDAAEDLVDEHYDSLPELNVGAVAAGPHPSYVNTLIAMGIGLGVTFFWFVAMSLLPKRAEGEDLTAMTYLRELFLDRGWPQYASTYLTFFCLGILILKWLNIRKQRRAMMIQALPEAIDNEINVNNLKEFHDNLINFPKNLRNTYIVNRIRKALEFFYIRQNNPEVAQMITSQSEVDAAKVSSSYGLVKVVLWAVPIMGFIGTVIGIGSAIGGFDAVLGAGDSGDMSALKGPLGSVLGSMSSAFDTTLLALVFSILLSFPASALQNQEDDLVTDVDEYCIDNLLKRLNDGGAGSNVDASDAGMLKAIGDAIAANQQSVMGKFESVQKNMATNLSAQVKQHEKVAEAVEAQMSAISERAEKYESKLDDGFFDGIERMRRDSVGAIEAQVKSLSEGIGNLNEVLKDLNGKQIQVQKKGWFGR